jgi:hypothetical protein
VAPLLLTAHREKLGKMTPELILEHTNGPGFKKLRLGLETILSFTKAVRSGLSVPVKVRFFVELREPGELKTEKPRDSEPRVEDCAARLRAALIKGKPWQVPNWFRESIRGRDGFLWASLGAAVLHAAVEAVFSGAGKSGWTM